MAGLVAAAAGVALAAGAATTQAAAAGNPMVAVKGGIDPGALRGAAVFGDTPPDTPETVSFVLAEQNLSALESTVEAGSLRHYLSVRQFASTYGQSTTNIAALQSYLAKFAITTQVYPDDVDVVANGPASSRPAEAPAVERVDLATQLGDLTSQVTTMTTAVKKLSKDVGKLSKDVKRLSKKKRKRKR